MAQYGQAIEVLERSLEESRLDGAAHDLFLLAMCHACLGDAAKAKDSYGRAVHWVQEQQGKLSAQQVEELNRFRAEAEAELGKLLKP